MVLHIVVSEAICSSRVTKAQLNVQQQVQVVELECNHPPRRNPPLA
jgi:hypothetical protein